MIPNEAKPERGSIHTPSPQKALEWITALAAAGFDYTLSREGEEWTIQVEAPRFEEAQKEIGEYERINAGWPPPPAPDRNRVEFYRGWSWAAFWGAHVVLLFYLWLGPYNEQESIFRHSNVQTAGILAGDWWRAITALMVHSDPVHLLSNLLFLVFFGMVVCRTFGAGLGWFLILAGGAVGNALVVVALRPEFASVGASTACFAALGILAASQSVENLRRFGRWRSIWSRAWIPLGAGLALLGLTGTDPRSNVAAHVFGFVAGAVAALPFSWAGVRWMPSLGQHALLVFVAGVVSWAWWKAVLAAGILFRI